MPTCIYLYFHLITVMMKRIMAFVSFWTLVNVILAFLLRDWLHYAARLMVNRTEEDCHLFTILSIVTLIFPMLLGHTVPLFGYFTMPHQQLRF
jgi:hypothetical protein